MYGVTFFYMPGGQHYMPAHTSSQHWLFIHVTWRALDQSQSRISDSDITIRITALHLHVEWLTMTLMIHWYYLCIHNSCTTITCVSTLSRHLLIISLSASVIRWFFSGLLETNVIHRMNQITPNKPATPHTEYRVYVRDKTVSIVSSHDKKTAEN